MQTENYIIARIEQLCKKKGISRYRLAQESAYAQSSISTLLNRKSVPTIQTLEKICEGLDITLALRKRTSHLYGNRDHLIQHGNGKTSLW